MKHIITLTLILLFASKTMPAQISTRPSLSLSGSAGSAGTDTVSYALPWTATVAMGAEWLSVSPDGASGTAVLTITAISAAPLTAHQRVGTVVITGENAQPDTITVVQSVSIRPAGSGTEIDPYQIATLNNLYWIRETNAYAGYFYVQTADIDASPTRSWFDGAGWNPIGDAHNINSPNKFSSHYNGRNHSVRELYINRPTETGVGLFGLAADLQTSIDSLAVVDCWVLGNNRVGAVAGLVGLNATIHGCSSSGSVSGNTMVGGLVGHVWRDISNCHSSANVYLVGTNGSALGGLVGFAQGSVSYCYATGDIHGNGTDELSDYIVKVGGLIGEHKSFYQDLVETFIDHCYATGNVVTNSANYCGGLIGRITEQLTVLKNSYATGRIEPINSVEGTYYWGGLIGEVDYTFPVENCYSTGLMNQGRYMVGKAYSGMQMKNCYDAVGITYPPTISKGYVGEYLGNVTMVSCFHEKLKSLALPDRVTINTVNCWGVTSDSTSQLQRQATFTDWNFDTVWTIREGRTYPGLRGVDNAPFAFNDSLKLHTRSLSLSTLLANDYDIESESNNLLLKVIYCSHGVTDSISTLTFPYSVAHGTTTALTYRIGEIRPALGDTLWGNHASAFITLDTTSASLPVELTGITACATGSSALLSWKTATEVNNYGFDIERKRIASLPAGGEKGEPIGGSQGRASGEFINVGFVPGRGSTNAQHDYSFAERMLAAGTYVYRLRQIDNNGAFTYSVEVTVTIEVPRVFALDQNYPNPFNPSTTIKFTLAEDSHVSLKVYDVVGREIATLINGNLKASEQHSIVFDASGLAGGMYIYRLATNTSSLVKKLMLVR